jgi:uncharacterized repeat protein (TIGR01451 family)
MMELKVCRRNRRRHLGLERLEGRALLAQFLVTTAADNGAGSLRQAILDANGTPGHDEIRFAIPAGQSRSIRPTSPLPDITDPVTIDGYTQSGASPNTLASGNDAVLQIEIDGRLAGPSASGLVIRAGGSTVRGLAIGKFSGYGIVLLDGNGNKVAGNFVGTDITGMTGNANALDGIRVIGSGLNTIGGTAPADRNVAAGNDRGGISFLNSSNNLVLNNYVGTIKTGRGILANFNGDGVALTNSHNNLIGAPGVGNVTSTNGSNGIALYGGSSHNLIQANIAGLERQGLLVLGNFLNGVQITDSPSNTIGGLTAEARNILTGNSDAGLGISGPGSTGNLVLGNYIGTDIFGTDDINNTNQGIRIQLGASNNTIGGAAAGAGNLVSGNAGDGIALIDAATANNVIVGNRVGLDSNGAVLANQGRGIIVQDAIGTRVGGPGALANVVSGNGSDGISISGARDTIVEGNLVGTDTAGNAARPNQASGIFLWRGARNTRIVGNLVSGNHFEGVSVTDPATAGTVVIGNRIGLAANGSILANGRSGVFIQSATGTLVGGSTPEASNLIAGNTLDGITLVNTAANVIQGNRIQGNLADGIQIQNANGTMIGGTAAGQGNLIVNNRRDGVTVIQGTANTIVGNAIVGNFGLGIGLGPKTNPPVPLPNDPGDADTGGNNLQNKPAITAIYATDDQLVPGTAQHQRLLTVTGTLNSTPGQVFAIHIYSSPTSPGSAQGRDYLGSTTAVTDAAGNATFSALLTLSGGAPVVLPDVFTATATDAAGNTSEFSPAATTTQPVQSTLSLSLVSAPPSAAPGDLVSYVYAVTNNGPAFATGVVVTDPTPAGQTLVGGSVSQGTFVNSGGVGTALLGNLAPGASATITQTFRIDAEGTITHTVVARGNEPGNSTGSAPLVVPISVIPPLRLLSAAWITPRRGGTQLNLTFSRPVAASLGANKALYRVVIPGRDRRFGTRDDRAQRIRTATVDASGTVVTIQFATKLNRRQQFQLTVSGGLTDTLGRALDGDRNGQPGGDAVVALVPNGTARLG